LLTFRQQNFEGFIRTADLDERMSAFGSEADMPRESRGRRSDAIEPQADDTMAVARVATHSCRMEIANIVDVLEAANVGGYQCQPSADW
jgi:hypothetical protein